VSACIPCSRFRAVDGDICALSRWNWRPRLSAVVWLDSINAKQIVVTFVHSAYIIASVIISRYLTVFVQSSVGASSYSVPSSEYLLSFYTLIVATRLLGGQRPVGLVLSAVYLQ